MTYDFDFAVAGGGPAGCSAAISLAMRGHSVVLFERDTFPRFHIGESLLATANDHFAALGVAERMDAAGFPQKWGARLFTHDGQSGRGVNFADVSEVRRPQTYQVPRAEFDRILLERAREVGVDVREGTRVTACEFAPDGAVVGYESSSRQVVKSTSGLSVDQPLDDSKTRRLEDSLRPLDDSKTRRLEDSLRPLDDSKTRRLDDSIRVRAMVDATGRNGLLARKFDLRNDEPLLANIAIFSHYSNVPRLPDQAPNDIRIVARNDSGWFWLIPISDELMSVGVVLPRNLFLQMPEGTSEERLERALSDTPIVAELMRDAKREWPVRVEKDFSYSAKAYAGDRWILAGDAGSFLDPVFSTGVSIAMESGIEAAAELDRALRRDRFSARSFAAFSRRQRRRFLTYRRFVIGFYSPEFRDLFFKPNPPRHLFRAVVTVLAGRWNASLRTRALNHLFFALVAVQKRFELTRRLFRREGSAGYPGKF